MVGTRQANLYTWNVDRAHELNSRNQMLELPQNRPMQILNNWQIWFVGHATVLIQIGPIIS